MSDLELYKGLKKGDRDTIVLIYDQLLPKVSNWITKNNGTQSDANDVFQETLETILLKVENIQSSFVGLVMSISKNKWIDKMRKQSTTEKTKAQILYTYKDELNNFSLENDQIEVDYQKHILMEKYFTQLSETCKQVMTMLKSGASVADIISTLSLASANTLYRRKAACIERWSTLIRQDPNYKQLYS